MQFLYLTGQAESICRHPSSSITRKSDHLTCPALTLRSDLARWNMHIFPDFGSQPRLAGRMHREIM